jgi:hypothetical protein
VSRSRDLDAAVHAAHLRWFAQLPAQRQLAHLRGFDGLPPRARVDLTTHKGRIAAHAKRHPHPRGGGRR